MEKVSKFKKYKWLILIFILASFLRFYRLNELPYAFDGDEAAFGYYGFSLLNSLSDEYGNKLPLYFPSIGDYKYPGYAYFTTLPVFLFGLNEFSTRFLSALSGSLLPVVIYLLVVELFGNRKLALVSAFLTAISPYSILFSRGAYESNLATFFLTAGIWWILRSLRSKNTKHLYLAIVPIVLSIFTYSATRVFLLLFLPSVLFIFLFKKSRLMGFQGRHLKRVVGILILIILFSLLDPRSRVRATGVGIFSDPAQVSYLEVPIREDGAAWRGNLLFVTRAFHNKASAFVLNFTKRYFEHYSPVYLFATSNPSLFKYSIPNMGLFYFFEFFTIVLGIIALGKIKDFRKLLVGAWVLFSAVPSSITTETPNPIRALLGLPSLIILSSLGILYLYKFFNNEKKKLFVAGVGIIITAHLIYFWHQYSIHDLYHIPYFTDGGVKEMVEAVNEFESGFDKVVVSRDPYIFFLFYNKVKPEEFLVDADILPEKIGQWERVERFGKISFKMPMDCPRVDRKDVLYVCRGREVPPTAILHKVIRFNDGIPAFLLIEFVPDNNRRQEDLPQGVYWMQQ